MSIEPSDDILDQDACAEIRRLLTRHGVPVAAFIDDHVANAIFQRNQARAAAEAIIEILVTAPRTETRKTIIARMRAHPGLQLKSEWSWGDDLAAKVQSAFPSTDLGDRP